MPAVMLIPAGNASAWTGPTGNNTFLLTGAVPTLVDAGVGTPGHLEGIANALGGAALEQVLITHAHHDHASGVPAILARWPSARVRQFPGFGAAPVPAGDTELLAVHTPGHAPEHTCFLDVNTRDVLCGDLVRLGGSIVIPASRGGSLGQYPGVASEDSGAGAATAAARPRRDHRRSRRGDCRLHTPS